MYVCVNVGCHPASIRRRCSPGLHPDRAGPANSSEEVPENAVHHTGHPTTSIHTYSTSFPTYLLIYTYTYEYTYEHTVQYMHSYS